MVGEVRTVGLTAAVELAPDVLAARPGIINKVARAAQAHGVLTRAVRGVALQFSPAFVISEDEIAGIAEGFHAALRDVAAG